MYDFPFEKIRMKGDVLTLFSGGGSVEDISSFHLSYYEQELHFLSLRIGFLKSGGPPYFRHFRIIFIYKNNMGWRGEPRYTKCDTDHTYSAAKLAGLEDMAEFLQRQAKSGANHTGAFNSARNPRSLWL